jgi:hypothetical protein
MVICGSYMHEFSVSKDMKMKIKIKGNDKRRKEVAIGKVRSGTFMPNTNYQRIEN